MSIYGTARASAIESLPKTRLSLVVVSCGRVAELFRLCTSLQKQNFQKLEVVLIDQTTDSVLDDLFEHFRCTLSIKRIRVAPCGISQARNEGLKHISGDWVAFPDDDCAYPPMLLTQIFQCLENQPELDGISCRVCDSRGIPSAGGVMQKNAAHLTVSNVWKTAVSCSFFIRRSIADATGPFDQTLGVGADSRYGSGEETDWLLRALQQGSVIDYRPDIKIFHPQPDCMKKGDIRKAFHYGCGAGRVLRKHHYPFWFILVSSGFQMFRASIELCRLNGRAALIRFNMAIGRLRG